MINLLVSEDQHSLLKNLSATMPDIILNDRQILAGPREAGLHMILGDNFGCTHFVIGHDHGSPGMCPNRQTQFSLQAPISRNGLGCRGNIEVESRLRQ